MIAATAVLCGVLYTVFKYSKIGIAMQAASQNQLAAYLNGVQVKRVNSLVWALLFVAVFGPGPLAGTLAIAFRSVGFTGAAGLERDTLVVVTADHETGYLFGPGSDPTWTPISGTAGSGGIARGRARIILDPSDPFALEPGQQRSTSVRFSADHPGTARAPPPGRDRRHGRAHQLHHQRQLDLLLR